MGHPIIELVRCISFTIFGQYLTKTHTTSHILDIYTYMYRGVEMSGWDGISCC